MKKYVVEKWGDINHRSIRHFCGPIVLILPHMRLYSSDFSAGVRKGAFWTRQNVKKNHEEVEQIAHNVKKNSHLFLISAHLPVLPVTHLRGWCVRITLTKHT